MIGIVGVRGVRSASSARMAGCSASMAGLWGATSILTRLANRFWRAYPVDQRFDLVGGPRDHGLAWRVVDAQGDLGVIGDQRLGSGHIEFRGGPCRPVRTAVPSAASGSRLPATPQPGSARRPPRRPRPRPSSARSPGPGSPRRNATTRSTPAACRSGRAGSARCPPGRLPLAITSCSENPACSTNTGSNSATAAAKAGSSASNRRPMPAHCEPRPE